MSLPIMDFPFFRALKRSVIFFSHVRIIKTNSLRNNLLPTRQIMNIWAIKGFSRTEKRFSFMSFFVKLWSIRFCQPLANVQLHSISDFMRIFHKEKTRLWSHKSLELDFLFLSLLNPHTPKPIFKLQGITHLNLWLLNRIHHFWQKTSFPN